MEGKSVLENTPPTWSEVQQDLHELHKTGFKQAWQGKDYQAIVKVAEKIPPTALEEDDKLLMWYDQAVTRMGG